MFSFFNRPALSISILLTTLSCFATAEDNQIELFVVDFPPYTIINPQNTITGVDAEVTQAAFAAVGIDAIISYSPWKRIIKNMQHGQIAGTITCSKQPGRESFILFSQPLSEDNHVAFTLKEFDANKLSTLSDLHNYRVTTVEKWGVERELTDQNINHTKAPDTDSGIHSVVFRNIDIFYNSELATLYRARQLDLQNSITAHRLKDKDSTPFHLCLSKHCPGNQKRIKQFNTGLEKIKNSGEFDAIYKKYL